MTSMRKGAGEARERPRPMVSANPKTTEAKPLAKPAGMAPVFDAQMKQLKPSAGPHKGMISNPWVKHWAGAGPAPTSSGTAGAQSPAGAKARAAPEKGSRRAGAHAPKSTHRNKK